MITFMRTCYLILILLFWLIFFAQRPLARQIDVFEGDRVRIKAEGFTGGNLQGTVIRVTDHDIEIRTRNSDILLPYSYIHQISVRVDERRYSYKGFLYGSAAGLFFISPLFMKRADDCDISISPECYDGNVYSVLLGVAIGAAFGTAVGYNIRTGIWMDVWQANSSEMAAMHNPGRVSTVPVLTVRIPIGRR
jgi:hypothetical protein